MKTYYEDINTKVTEELVALLYKRFHFVLVGESLAAMIYIIILWDVENHALLLSWLTLNLLINGVMRHILVFLYHHKYKLCDVKQWRNLFVLAAFFAGLVWGVGSFLFLFTSDDFHRIVLILILVGLAGASSAVYLPGKKACLANVLPIYFCVFILLISEGSLIGLSLSVAILVLVTLTIKLSFGSSDVLANSLHQQFKNKELLEKVFMAKRELELKNININNEIEIRKDIEKTLSDMATHDPLTKLKNRHYLYNHLEHLVKSNKKLSALLLLDLDGFKTINDTLGHDVGDELLIQVANRIKYSLRGHDVISRFGGDEFCIILEEIESVDDVDIVAKKICRELSKPFTIQQNDISISASVGISLYPKDGKDIITLLKNADIALYQAKDKGKNTYQYFA